jgi:hypothetical protein
MPRDFEILHLIRLTVISSSSHVEKRPGLFTILKSVMKKIQSLLINHRQRSDGLYELM